MKKIVIIKRFILIASLLILVSGSILIAYFCDKYNDKHNTESISVVLVGDILLDRGVRKKIEENGYTYP